MEQLVFLPGLMCDQRLFAPQLEHFGKCYGLHVPDYGLHQTMDGLIDDLLKQLPSRFSLAGLSLGGIVALALVRRAPERIERLALLDTNAKAETDAVKKARDPQIDEVRHNPAALESIIREEYKPKYLSDACQNRGAVLNKVVTMAVDLGPERFIAQSRLLQNRPDQVEALSLIQAPTLILMGRDDQLCPLDRHELMHKRIPHSVLKIIEGAGHLPTLEQPNATNRALEEWLASGNE